MEIGIDQTSGDDTTVYTIPHKMAFRLLERQICQMFHDDGRFNTHTSAMIQDGEITFTVTIRKDEKEGI